MQVYNGYLLMSKFRDKYRIESNRLRGWDYSRGGVYYITIVTANQRCLFGDIVSDKIILNDFGTIVNDEWMKSFDIRQELFLDEYVVMPNHLHAIVMIGEKRLGNMNDNVAKFRDGRPSISNPDASIPNNLPFLKHEYIKHIIAKSQEGYIWYKSSFSSKPKTLSSFVRCLKSAVINQIDDYIDANQMSLEKFNRYNPLWQANFHDHIIRDYDSYLRIVRYIRDNPKNWNDERNYY